MTQESNADLYNCKVVYTNKFNRTEPSQMQYTLVLLLIFVVMQFQQNLGINQKASKAKTKHLPSSPKMLPL